MVSIESVLAEESIYDISINVTVKDEIKVKFINNTITKECKLKSIRNIYKVYDVILNRFFRDFSNISKKELSDFVKFQKDLRDYTDFRIYEYKRINKGIDLIDKDLKLVYLGDILIVLLKENGLIKSDIKRLYEKEPVYQCIANKIYNNKSTVGELLIRDKETIEIVNNSPVLKLPNWISTKGSYRNPIVESVSTINLLVENEVIPIQILNNYIYEPTKLIDGKPQEPVRVIQQDIKFKE